MANYIDTIYDETLRPKTEYPSQLSTYISERFGIPKGAKILDAGCGRGDFLNGFKDLGLEVNGVDGQRSSSDFLNGIDVKYLDMEKDQFPYKDNTFDVIFSKSVLEHFFNPEQFMKECHRILKPGGRLILLVPDWHSQMKIYFDDYSHRQPYTTTAVKDLLKMFEFKTVESELFYQLPVLWKYPFLKTISFILRLLVPVTLKSNIKFIRWSVELMILGTGVK